MRVHFFSFAIAIVVAATFGLSGCGDASKAPESKSTDAHAGHDHDAHADHDHDDAAEGPHGGHLVILGDHEYHAELVHDEKTQTVTVYLLDAAAKQPVVVRLPEITLQLLRDGKFAKYVLKAAPGAGDAEGTASKFESVDAALAEALDDDHVQGRLQVTIDGKSYSGTIEHHGHDDEDGHDEPAHDDEGHEHEGHDHEGHEHAGHDHDTEGAKR